MPTNMAALFKTLTQGVYVIGVADQNQANAFTAAWVMQTSFQPMMLALSINPNHSSWALLQSGAGFSVNVLSDQQLDLAAHFAKPASTNKLAAINWHPSNLGYPIIDSASAWFECQYLDHLTSGDHIIVSAKVCDGQLIDSNALPLNYRQTLDLDQSASLYPDSF